MIFFSVCFSFSSCSLSSISLLCPRSADLCCIYSSVSVLQVLYTVWQVSRKPDILDSYPLLSDRCLGWRQSADALIAFGSIQYPHAPSHCGGGYNMASGTLSHDSFCVCMCVFKHISVGLTIQHCMCFIICLLSSCWFVFLKTNGDF